MTLVKKVLTIDFFSRMCFRLTDWSGLLLTWNALKLLFMVSTCSWQKIVEIPSRISMISLSVTEMMRSLKTECLRYSGQTMRIAGRTATKQQNAKTRLTPCMLPLSVWAKNDKKFEINTMLKYKTFSRSTTLFFFSFSCVCANETENNKPKSRRWFSLIESFLLNSQTNKLIKLIR